MYFALIYMNLWHTGGSLYGLILDKSWFPANVGRTSDTRGTSLRFWIIIIIILIRSASPKISNNNNNFISRG